MKLRATLLILLSAPIIASTTANAAATCAFGNIRTLMKQLKTNEGPTYQVTLRSMDRPYVIEGKVQALKLAPDYEMYFIKDEKGQIHVTDSAQGPRKDGIVEIGAPTLPPRKRPEVVIDAARAKKYLCAQYNLFKGTEDFKKVAPLLERKFDSAKLEKSATWKCAMSSMATLIPAFGADPFQKLRISWAKEHTHQGLREELDHVGNFYETMLLMGAVRHCSILFGGAPGPALMRALKVSVVGNVVSEVNVAGAPIPNLPDTLVRKAGGFSDEIDKNTGKTKESKGWRIFGDRKKTDWGDLGTGMAGAAAYLGWVTYSKKMLGFSFEKECRSP